MTEMLPYLLTALVAILFLSSIVFITRKFRKNLSIMEERLISLENALEKTKTSLGEQSARSTDEINHNNRLLKEEIRSALQASIESVIKKVMENESAQKSRLDSFNAQISALRQKVDNELSKPVEKTTVPQPTMQIPPKQTTAPADDARAKARRLARLIVSDIALYYRKSVEQGVKEGNFYEVLAHEVREARSLYERRVPEEIRNATTYLDEAFAELILKTRKELNL